MTTYAASGRPSYGVFVWCDDNFIYTELPCKDGPPFIQKHALTENGLGKALGQMRDLARAAAHPVMLTTHPKLTGKARLAPNASQRANALSVLRRLKII